jgi:hypothetical protein
MHLQIVAQHPGDTITDGCVLITIPGFWLPGAALLSEVRVESGVVLVLVRSRWVNVNYHFEKLFRVIIIASVLGIK